MRQLFHPAIRLMNRLPYPQKFALISLLFALPLGLVLWLFFGEITSQVAFARKELAGTTYLRPLRHLFADALTGLLPAGADAGAPAGLLPHAATIDADFAALDPVDQQVGGLLGTTATLTTLQASWRDLQRPDLAAAVRQDREIQFVADIRGLLAQVGDSSNLVLDSALDSSYVTDAVLLKLPTGENLLAQVAALGGQGVARQSLSVEERAQLNVLAGLLRANSTDLQHDMTVAGQNNPSRNLQPALGAPLQESLASTNVLLGMVQ